MQSYNLCQIYTLNNSIFITTLYKKNLNFKEECLFLGNWINKYHLFGYEFFCFCFVCILSCSSTIFILLDFKIAIYYSLDPTK